MLEVSVFKNIKKTYKRGFDSAAAAWPYEEKKLTKVQRLSELSLFYPVAAVPASAW